MARTVDTSSTLENFRVEHNNLANDVGAIGNLTTGDTSSIVNAINYIMDQYFFFQDFDFDGSDGATSNTVFSGADNAGTTLSYAAGKVLVYKNGLLLRSGTDYTATNGTSITLASSANNSDVIRVSSYTGSYENVGSAAAESSDQWVLAGGTIHNKNTGGIVLNADSSITTALAVSDTIQLDGDVHQFGNMHLKGSSNSSVGELKIYDNDNSHYVSLDVPATLSGSPTFTLPGADGGANHVLKTDGNGNLSFAVNSASDVAITANNSTDETVYLIFVDGATGTQGLESDTGLTYNPSSGVLTSTQFTGALSGNATTATALASNRNFSISGDITASAVAFNGSGNVALSATIDDNTVDADALNVGSNGTSGQALLSDGDGSFSWGEAGKTTEQIQDIAGAMFTSNTETGISATYEDGDGTIDLVVSGITSSMITDGTIATGDIADDAITAAKIDDNAVGAAALNVSGNGTSGQILASDGDGTFSWTADSGLSTEQVQDIVGAMFTGNTETRGSLTYQDSDGTIDLVVDDMNDTLSTEQVQDIVGAMFTSNTETRISATYEDSDGTIDLVVDDMTANDNTQLSAEEVQDIVGAMFTGNTETRGSLTYQDSDGTIDLSVDNMNYSLPLSASGTRGGVQIGYSENGKNYPVELSSEKMYVNVPWTDTQLSTSDVRGKFSGGTGVSISSGSISIGQDVGTSADVQFDTLRVDSLGVGMAATSTDGRIDASNDIVAYSSSDIALKENINPITNALDKVLSLGGYTFDWKKDREIEHGYSGSDIGVMAQEVEEVLPTAVRENNYGNKAVRYEKLIPLLLQSIKELKTELDELKSSNS